MKTKQFQEDTAYSKYDLNHDGIITDEELVAAKEIGEAEAQIRKLRAQKYMASVALGACLVFTLLLVSPAVSVERVNALSDLFGLFYISMAGIVGAYMGVSAWMSRK
jgi:hypothetical protein